MGGQVLGGGVIVLTVVGLWLVYLLPSWHRRRQFDAAERNAMRLNRALRVLAETSEAPDEVRVELGMRSVRAQQQRAKRAQADRERAERHAEAEDHRLAAQAAKDRERAQLISRHEEALAARLEKERARHAARTGAAGLARQARARRRVRLVATLLAVAGVAAAVWGVVSALPGAVWGGGVAVIVGAVVLVQMARVAAHVRARAAGARTPATASAPARVAAPPQRVQDFPVAERRDWQPRELPVPLTVSAGSQASAVMDEVDARETLRQAELDAPLRAQAARERPTGLDAARLARMGRVDDAEIEAHVRKLLDRRAAG